jgi:hypothetical protein
MQPSVSRLHVESETGVFRLTGTPALDSNAVYRRMPPTLSWGMPMACDRIAGICMRT